MAVVSACRAHTPPSSVKKYMREAMSASPLMGAMPSPQGTGSVQSPGAAGSPSHLVTNCPSAPHSSSRVLHSRERVPMVVTCAHTAPS